MKKVLIAVVSVMLVIGFSVPGAMAGTCSTQYPILLVHGVALGDNTLGFDYFGRIPDYLRSYGAIVEGGEQDAWSSGSDNALQLKNKIEEVCAAYGVSKVNIIAHSKGGIDARYMFRDYPETKNMVAAFISVASPARGSVLADIIFNAIPDWAEPYVGDMIDVIGMIVQGDESAESLDAGYQLLTDSMAEFNDEMGDLDTGINGVFCQSYAAKIKGVVLDPMLQASGLAMTLGGESPNDGAVWVESAKYADYQGAESGSWWCGGVTHFGIVDRGIGLISGFTPGFDAREFYKDIVSDLKSRGY